jgi:hypothetical protein
VNQALFMPIVFLDLSQFTPFYALHILCHQFSEITDFPLFFMGLGTAAMKDQTFLVFTYTIGRSGRKLTFFFTDEQFLTLPAFTRNSEQLRPGR